MENTACCQYWERKANKKDLLCSLCDPGIGKRHGRFERRTAAGMLIDQTGCLWSKEVIMKGTFPLNYEIVGIVGDGDFSVWQKIAAGQGIDKIMDRHQELIDALILISKRVPGLDMYVVDVGNSKYSIEDYIKETLQRVEEP